MFLVTSPIVINVPTRGLLAVETMHAIVRWLENLNNKRNMTSMFVNKKHRYKSTFFASRCNYQILIVATTGKPVAHKFQIKLDFRNVGFCVAYPKCVATIDLFVFPM